MLEHGRTVRMDLRRKLPGVCARHGQPAVEFRSGTIGFFADNEQIGLPRILGHGYVMNNLHARFAWRDFRDVRSRGVVVVLRGRPVAGEPVMVRGEWPVCRRCVRQSRALRIAGFTAVLAAIATVSALVAASLFDLRQFLVPLGFAVLPGWIPIGLLVTIAVFDRAGNHARGRLTPDRRFLVIAAHPDFAEAWNQRPSG